MNRIALHNHIFFIVSLVLTQSYPSAADNERIVVSKNVRWLFFDDDSIDTMEHVVRTVNSPQKHPGNPVLKREHPWEGFRVQAAGTFYYDAETDLFKAWYMNIPKTADESITVQGLSRPGHATLLSYAESDDGFVWRKPILHQVDFEGSTANNMFGPDMYNPEGFSVLHEPDDPDPSRRYKAFYWDHGRGPLVEHEGVMIYGEGETDGMHVAFSPDGIHWTPFAMNPVLKVNSDTGQCVLYDPQIKKYVAYGRFGFGRRVARTESADFIHWTTPELVLEPDMDEVGSNVQFYGISVDLYEGIYVGMLWMFHIDSGSIGRIDFQLCHSRDGIHWIRDPQRAVFMPLGPEGEWDGGDMRPACRSVILPDRQLIYYSGSKALHGLGGKLKIGMDIGVATLRRDGWISLDANEEAGTIVTKPFLYPGGDLHINADATHGSLKVEILTEGGMPFRNPLVANPLTRDTLDWSVDFQSPPSSDPAGQFIRLKITLQNAKLYSFWFQ